MTTITADHFLKNAFIFGGIVTTAFGGAAYGSDLKHFTHTAHKSQVRAAKPITEAPKPEVDGMYLSARARALVGEHGAERFNRFKKLREGWDAGRGLPLDVEAVQTMDRFIESMDLQPAQVALFMSATGHPILNWIDRDGGTIELEFRKDSINYYNETAEIEDDYAVNNIVQLMARLEAA